MTIVLTPVWSNGVQKLKIEGGSGLSYGFLAAALMTLAWVEHVCSWARSFLLSLCGTAMTGPKPAPRGTLPPAHNELVHAMRCMAQLRSKDKDIEKYIYLSQLKHTDENMFYRLCLNNMSVSDCCLASWVLVKRPNRNSPMLYGAGIYPDYLHSNCWRCLLATFTHLPSA